MAEVFNQKTDDYCDEEYVEQLNLSEEDSSISFEPSKSTPQHHIHQAEVAIQNLKFVINEPGWKKILQHKSGISVYSKPGVTYNKLPIFMGEHIIEGFSPQAVFAVIGMRKLWDDWYEEGNLVENLDETTSLTYMVMQALAGSKTRDLSLVEKIDCAQNGTIYFVSTSVETPRVPRVANRIRAHIILNGWVLEPLSYNPPRTKATYVLQIKVKGWVPSVVSKTYLARRPLVLYTIDQYLKKNGAPPMVIGSSPPESIHSDSSIYKTNSIQSNDFKYPRRKISFTYLNETNSPTPTSPTPQTFPTSPTSATSPMSPTSATSPMSPTSVTSPMSPTSVTSPMSPTSATSSTSKTSKTSQVSPTSPTSPTSTREIKNNSLSHQDNPKGISSSVRLISPVQIISTTTNTENVLSQSTFDRSATVNKSIFKSPAKITKHRHTESVRKALETFNTHLPMDGWDLYSEDKGLKIYMKEFRGKSTPIMRGDGVISGGFTTRDILSIIKNLDMRKLWDDRYEEGAVYEMFNLNERLVRTAMKGTFPISGRDMSICEILDHDEDTGILQLISTSVVDQLIPESKKLVRAHLDFAGWRLKPNFDSDGNTISVDVIYIVDVDVKLDTIPSSIRKTLSTQIPMIVVKIDELMQKIGFPPYVLNSTTKVIKEGFIVKNSQYDLSLIAEGGGVTEFKVSKLMYPNGVNVSTVPENCKVELLSDSSEIIRVTLPPRVDLDSLMITISKHSKGFKLTYNNEKTIPMVSDSNEDEKQNVTTSESTTLVANGTIDNNFINNNASDSQIHKKLSTSVSRGVITPDTFYKPSEVSSKSEPYQLVIDKQTLLENKIAAVTRASREIENGSAPPEVTALSEVTAPPEVTALSEITAPPEVTALSEVTAPPEVTPKTEESVVKKLNEIIGLAAITDSFRFNSQQVGLIFASMLLAYYAGKLST